MRLLTLALLCIRASAGEASYSSKDAAVAAAESLRNGGATSVWLYLDEGKPPRVTWIDPKSGPVLAPASDVATKDADTVTMKALALQWQLGTISAADKDTLLKMLVLRFLGMQ